MSTIKRVMLTLRSRLKKSAKSRMMVDPRAKVYIYIYIKYIYIYKYIYMYIYMLLTCLCSICKSHSSDSTADFHCTMNCTCKRSKSDAWSTSGLFTVIVYGKNDNL